jgi:transposase, IS6 family
MLSVHDGFRFPEVDHVVRSMAPPLQLSYRDLEELVAERNIEVDHLTRFRWVQRFTPSLVDAARRCRHNVENRWFVDETYVKNIVPWSFGSPLIVPSSQRAIQCIIAR